MSSWPYLNPKYTFFRPYVRTSMIRTEASKTKSTLMPQILHMKSRNTKL